jgi:tight adherence protein B
MNNDLLVFMFILLVPVLLVSLVYFVYLLYKEYTHKRIIIDVLANESNQILDKKKKKRDATKKNSFLKNKLNFAGFPHATAEYIFIIISISFGILAGLFIFIVVTSPIIFIITSIIASFFPYLVLSKLISMRQEEFNFGLKSIIDKVTSMMKSGVGFEQAFKKSILTTKSDFTKEVFDIYLKEKDIIGEDRAFNKMFQMVESKELRIFYLVISIGKQSGGKFSNTLDTLRKTLHDQGTIKQEIASSTKEIKIGTYMIIALTVGIFFLMDTVFKGALIEHFFYTDNGKIQLFFIMIWVAFGLFINNMLTKIKG